MIPIEGQPILTAAQMRAAEERAIAAGSSVEELMERAGAGVAEQVRRLAMGAPILVLCGPGNNGGDGYVAARILKTNGADIRIAALSPPKTEAAAAAAKRWEGQVATFDDLADASDSLRPVVVDAVFGTGLSRAIEPKAAEAIGSTLNYSRLAIAVDLPSGVDTDTGAELGLGGAECSLTLALGALKPAHLLQPSAERCGTVRIIDIGLGLEDVRAPRTNVSRDEALGFPLLSSPQYWSHKYTRGMVVVIGGAMPGAAAMAVQAAMRAGAGYGLLLSDTEAVMPHAVVRRNWSTEGLTTAIEGKRNVSVVIGPGLGRDADAEAKLAAAIDCEQRLVVDGDALGLLRDHHFETFRSRAKLYGLDPHVVLTPHEGEFKALFGDWSGSKIEAARAAAEKSGATVIFKGAPTVIAHPNGWTNVAPTASAWLSTAGTGDVLAGIVGATFFSSVFMQPAEAAVWIHAEAARRLGGSFIADDLVRELSVVRASL
jgi:hydroxyethylthiazole kinase-like uncharacterized protein yjeF